MFGHVPFQKLRVCSALTRARGPNNTFGTIRHIWGFSNTSVMDSNLEPLEVDPADWLHWFFSISTIFVGESYNSENRYIFMGLNGGKNVKLLDLPSGAVP